MAAMNDVLDWQTNKNLSERNSYMLENELATDITFKVSATPKGKSFFENKN